MKRKRALQLAKKVKQREQKSDDNLSKALLFILRHGALKLEYCLLPGRFLHVEDILQRQGDLKNVTLEDVMRVVQAVNKQRLSLKIDAGSQMYKIRANHWHSMHVEDFDLEPLLRASDCTYAVHETQLVVLESILKKGLSRMGRNHIHLITGDIDELKKSKEVLIYLDVQKALDGGYSFFRSGDRVILCPGNHDGVIPTKFLKGIYQTSFWRLLHTVELLGADTEPLGKESSDPVPFADESTINVGGAKTFCICKQPYKGEFMF